MNAQGKQVPKTVQKRPALVDLRCSARLGRYREPGEDYRAETGSGHGEHGFVAGGAKNDLGVDAVAGEGLLDGRLCAVGWPGNHRRPVELCQVDGPIGEAPAGGHQVVWVVEEFEVLDVGVVDAVVVEEQVDR